MGELGLLEKIVRAEPGRPTRLHDGKGNRVSAGRLLAHGPRALASGLARLALGRRPEYPWISYAAVRDIARRLTPRSSALEFGSGRSTLWLAPRCGRLYSVEDSAEWHAFVRARLDARGHAHVTYLHTEDPARYAAFPEDAAGPFDLVVVDGSHRTACVRAALPRVAPGGALYIDNTDGDLREAEALVAEAAARDGGRVTFYTDFAPAQLYVSQGLLYERPA